ncbi:hypothetical protein D7X55_18635 [Corallococcus sp. AB049A]|uniref:hypothetical protein n=1 Tax=Corallococcus sp. AB049A TaxID=2316721 RepID=UPI000ECF471E|nr:hypothetical protein [Corallococcus sp. AB049A]RKI64056.1 hypothetical protein D7X55_18635 [Corallococcus sp. AB049A]
MHRAVRLFAPVVGVLGLLGLVLFYFQRADKDLPFIQSDGYGHYVYLPALFIQHDPTFHKEVASWGEYWDPNVGLTLDAGTHRYLNRFPPGQALLTLPAFFLAHASAGLVGAPRDGFSSPYQVAVALNGLLALVIGLALLSRALQDLYPPAVVLATLTAVTFATNLFHYGTADACFSHVYSFALFAALMLLVPRWYAAPTARRSLLLGLVAGLIVLVRNPNALALLFIPLYGVHDGATQRARLQFLRAHLPSLALAGLAFAAVMSVLFGFWHYATGHWLVYSYQGFGFQFDRPMVLAVLFSIRKGLFFWAPVWLFAAWGFVRDRERLRPYLLPFLLFFILHTYLVSAWWHWPYGRSFGHRAYTEASAFFAPGLAGLLATLRRPASRRLMAGVLVLLVLLQGFLMLRYWQGKLPGDRTTWPVYRSLFTPSP